MFPSPFPSKKEFYTLSLQLPRPPLQRAYYRLPDSLFADAKITVDLVFLQKTDKTHEWQDTRRKTIGEYSKPINEYFFNNPHHVLGELHIVSMYNRMGITCKSSGDLRIQLAGVYSKIKKIL